MRLRCRANVGSALGPYAAGLFYAPETRFSSLEIGNVYGVYGLSLYREAELGANLDPLPEWHPPQAGLTALLCHEYDAPPTLRPDWYPIGLFSVEDPRMPEDWQFSTILEFGASPESGHKVLARWGYPLLVHSDDHFDGLAARDPKALADFRTEYEKRGQEPP